MFKSIGSSGATLTVFWNEQPIAARAGETVAACLMRARVSSFRATSVSGAARLPYCMIGHCFDCLLEIDGTGNRQACLTLVEDGMKLRRQDGAASLPGLED